MCKRFKELMREDARLTILRQLAASPKGMDYVALLNAVALNNVLVAKLIKQLASDGFLIGDLKANSFLEITPSGVAEYYRLQSLYIRDVHDLKMRRMSVIISIISLVISLIALVPQFL